MPFLLKRGQPNQALEVQRWQWFLHRQGIHEVGALGADFGRATERATTIFQRQNQLPETGALDSPTIGAARDRGYTVVPDDHYDRMQAAGPFPVKPKNLASPTHELRTRTLGCYMFSQPPLAFRGDKDGILIRGTCDGSSDDWERDNIVPVAVPEMAQHPARIGTPRFIALLNLGCAASFSARFATACTSRWRGSMADKP